MDTRQPVPEVRVLVEAAQLFVAGELHYSALVTPIEDCQIWCRAHRADPGILRLVREWEELVDRTWNEYHQHDDPLTEDELRSRIRDDLGGLGYRRELIECATCGASLTRRPLASVPGSFSPDWEDEREIIPAGRFWRVNHTFWSADAPPTSPLIVVNGSDAADLRIDDSHWEGCCGNSNHVPNRRCRSCDELVGTRIEDCWTSYYLYFDAQRVVVRL